MVLNVGRKQMENGQKQPTTDMTTTKQNEVTLKNQCKQWNQYQILLKITIKLLKPESFNILQSTS